MWSKRTYGRAPRGQRVIRQVNARDSNHTSVIFAVSNIHGIIHHAFKEGGYRTTDFKEFLERSSQMAADRAVVFIFDNAPSHGGARSATLQQHHSFRFQPPYSPFFNLCEGSFSIWKAAFKQRSRLDKCGSCCIKPMANRVRIIG